RENTPDRTGCLACGYNEPVLASRNAATPVALVYPVSMGPSFLQAFQNRLGTLGILPADPKLRHRMPRIGDPEGAEAFAHHPAANPLLRVPVARVGPPADTRRTISSSWRSGIF